MLTVKTAKNSENIASLAISCGLDELFHDTVFVLCMDDEVIGVADIEVEETSRILSVGVLPNLRGRGYGDFFTRTLMFMLSDIATNIEIGYSNSYFIQFGFEYAEDGKMTVETENLVFPHGCKSEGI